MKRLLAVAVCILLLVSLAACVGAEEKVQNTQEQTTQTETSTPDADWNLPETIEMTDEVTAVFEKAMEGLTGVNYEPQGYLGEKDGVYCILCKATLLYPGTKPYYALVYVSEAGVQNIWDIWMGAHAEKKD